MFDIRSAAINHEQIIAILMDLVSIITELNVSAIKSALLNGLTICVLEKNSYWINVNSL